MSKQVMIIAFSGKAGSGKDTSAAMTERILRRRFHNLQSHKVSFAGPLKEMATKYFPFCDVITKDPISRLTLQGLGTLMREEVDRDYWVDKALGSIVQITNDAPDDAVLAFFITDLRFENEAERLRSYIFPEQPDVEIIRLENRTALTGEAAQHASETDLDNYKGFDFTYDNTGTLEDLEAFLRSIYG